jgi:hypothetical protein
MKYPIQREKCENPVSHYIRDVKIDAQGKFEFDNVPFNNYHLVVTSQGFQPAEQDVDMPLTLYAGRLSANLDSAGK